MCAFIYRYFHLQQGVKYFLFDCQRVKVVIAEGGRVTKYPYLNSVTGRYPLLTC